MNDWVAVDNKLDGWKEAAAVWPAVIVQPGRLRQMQCSQFLLIFLKYTV